MNDDDNGVPPLKWQVEHIEEHLDAFHNHAGPDLSPAEYLYQYATYKDGEIYERLCNDLGITPRQGPPNNERSETVAEETTDRKQLEMQLTMNMEVDGSPLTAERRAEIEAQVGTQPAEAPEEAETNLQPGGLQALIQSELAKALGGVQQQQPVSLEDVLKGIDPRDSDAALALFGWLTDNGRLSIVATLNGGGGYLFHYSEPKGATKEGYIPGATQGGRMVDAAVASAKASGAKPKDTGLCDKCWSAVEKREDGSIVTDDDTASAACSAGGQHTFNA